MTSGYSISLIADLLRGTSQSFLRVAWTSVFPLIPLPFLAFFRHMHKMGPNVIEFLPVAPS